MSRISRDRGNLYEREVATAIEDELGVVTKRKLGQARDSGNDIDITRDNGTRFRLECKRRRVIGNLYEWMQQAQDSCDVPGDTPAVICRADGAKSLVVLTLPDFLSLVRESL